MTRRMQQHDPVDLMLEMFAGMSDGAVERQEARGQREAVGDGQHIFLACDLRNCTDEQLEAMGIQFEGDGDGVMRPAKLPPGWELKATDHSMWNKLVDDQDRERASMFYKAAFYDRKARLRLEHRYSVTAERGECNDPGKYQRTFVEDRQTGKRLHQMQWMPKPAGDDADEGWRRIDEQSKKARAWLDEHYPDHRDPLAYWS